MTTLDGVTHRYRKDIELAPRKHLLCRLNRHDKVLVMDGWVKNELFIRSECARGCGAYWLSAGFGPDIRMG